MTGFAAYIGIEIVEDQEPSYIIMKKLHKFFIPIELFLLFVIVCRYMEDRLMDKLTHVTAEYFKEQEKAPLVPVNAKAAEQEEVKKVALTFDDGPNACYTEELLDGLAVKEVKATFFLIGKKVDESPEIVKRIFEEGHLIGNHSYDHVNLNEMSEEKACEQIHKTNEAIKNVTGMIPEYLRPPFGSFKKNLDSDMNMIEVLWDVDPRDWSVKNTGKVVNRVVTNVQDGDIILLHDEYATSVAAAMEIIDILKSQGYEFVTVDELIFE